MKSLEGKIALVTGASRGIGRAIAMRLAKEGAVIAVHYGNRSDAAEKTIQDIKSLGGEAFSIKADLSSMDEINYLFQKLDAQLIKQTGYNHFDILVNNAGITSRGTIEETNEEMFDQVFSINVKAPFFLIKQALPRLRDGGRIINVSSGVTRIAYPDITAYNLTKGAINTLTLTLAKQLGPREITVNALLPGIIDTEINDSWLHTPEGKKYAEEMSIFGRVGKGEDVADAAAFLASSDSRWVTAQLLDVTGGSHL